MRIHVCLSWFDEPPEFLTRVIRSAAASGCHSIVAVDGAYGLLPGGRPASDPKQQKAVMAAARAAGVGLVLSTPTEVWPTEMDKRNHLFEVANTVAERGTDWFFVLDADHEVHADPALFQARLFACQTAVARVHAYTPPGPNGSVTFGPPERFACRSLFRAQEITVERNHFTYIGRDGERLWGTYEEPLVDAEDLSEIVQLTHWTFYRPKQRNQRQYDYYRARDKDTGERGPCGLCGKHATTHVPKFIKRDGDRVEAVLQEVCDDCYGEALRESRARAEEWNLADMALTAESR